MIRFSRSHGIGALAVALLSASPASTQAASLLERQIYLVGPRFDAQVPACDAGLAHLAIRLRFAQKEGRFWNSAERIDAIEQAREIAVSPWGRQHLPRRFCSGIAVMGDGQRREISFSIGEDTGYQGLGDGVDFCVQGFDRNMAYAADCKMARP